MDGLAAITQRMSQIQATIDSFAPPRVVTPTLTSGPSFEQVLERAVDGLSPLDPPNVPTAAWTSAGVPADLARHGNGRVPLAELSMVGSTGHRLWAPAGSALEQLMADAAADGITIGITDSYRSFAAQVDVAQRKGLYSQGGLAAEPGTSPHGWGIAVDLDLDADAQAWMRSHADRYGFVEDTPREPWHWVYRQ